MVGARTCCVNNSEIARFARQVATIFYHLFVDSIGSLCVLLQKEFCSLPRSVFLSLYLSLSKSRARFRSLSVRMAGLLKRSGRGWSLVCLFLHATKSVLCVCVFLTRERICLPRRRRREKSKSKKRKKNSLFRCIKKIIFLIHKKNTTRVEHTKPARTKREMNGGGWPPAGENPPMMVRFFLFLSLYLSLARALLFVWVF